MNEGITGKYTVDHAVKRYTAMNVVTVADLSRILSMIDQELPIYGAQYIDHPTRGRCAIAVPPTVSRERVQDSRWIGKGDDLNAAVVWTRAEQPKCHPLTDEQIDELWDLRLTKKHGAVTKAEARIFARAIEAAITGVTK